MKQFDYHPQTRIVFGADRIDELGQLAAELGARRALVVSDGGIVAAGHTARGVRALAASNVDACVFEGVHENPTTVDVERGTTAAREYNPDLIVGLGGGSSMDCAKGINFLLTNGGRMQDYWGVGKAKLPMLPMIAVPTTAGTGSEAQSFALISDAETHIKMACGDPKAAFRVAILDPQLTLTQPTHVTVMTGVDAMAHAVETFVTTRRNEMSMAFSREAWRRLASSFLDVLRDPGDLKARANMQLGACLAGLAIENSMLGAAHALANPLTANYGIAHGQAVGLMLPHVVRFNATAVGDAYAALGSACPHPVKSGSLDEFLASVLQESGLKTRLGECDVPPDALPKLAAGAVTQWTAQFNPRPVTEPQLLELYQAAF